MTKTAEAPKENTPTYYDQEWYYDERLQDWVFVSDFHVYYGSKCVGKADAEWLREHPRHVKTPPAPQPISTAPTRTVVVAGKPTTKPAPTKGPKGAKNDKTKRRSRKTQPAKRNVNSTPKTARSRGKAA